MHKDILVNYSTAGNSLLHAEKAQYLSDLAGGNDVKIKCISSREDATELHAFWDDLLGKSNAAPDQAITAAAALQPAEASLAAQQDENDWISESFAIAKKSVYASPIGDGDGPFTLTDTYQKESIKIAKQQIALAGTRLAALLNDAFK
jgi:hypothetical protein